MSNTQLERSWTLDRELVLVAGSFAPNGSSAISAASNKGKGWSVAYTTTGVYTITFTHDFVDLVAADCKLQVTTAADKKVQLGLYTAATATARATLVINNLTTASLADLAADAGTRIHHFTWWRQSGATP